MSWPKGLSRKGYRPGTIASDRVRKSREYANTNTTPEQRADPFWHLENPRQSALVRSAVVLKATTRATYSPYEEVGYSGLKQISGFLQEEFIQDLRGQKGARIYREMVDNNADLGAFMQLVKRLLQQVTWRFEPFSSQAKHVEQAEWFDGCLEDMEHSWSETLSEILTMLQYGYAPMEVTLKVRRGWSRDTRKRSRFDDGLIGWRKLALRAQDSVWQWLYDDENRELRALVQLPPPIYSRVEIPIDKILNFRTDVERNSPEGRSLLRSAYQDYYLAKRLTAIAAIGAERNLAGIPVMSIPAECMRGDATSAEAAVARRAWDIVTNIRVDEQAGVVLPMQYDPETKQPLYKLELLTVSGTGKGSIDVDALIKRHQTNVLRAVLSDWMMLGTGSTGSWALSADRTDQFGVVLGGIMDIICGVMNRQAVPALARLNGWDLNELPMMEHGDVESPDLEKLGDFIQKVTAVGALTADDELEDYLREAAHLPMRLETDEDAGVETRRGVPDQSEEPEPPEEDIEEEPEPAGDQVGKAKHQTRARRGTYALGASSYKTLSLLRDRQRTGPGDVIAHGFKIADAPYPWPLNREMTSEVESAPVRTVNLSDLLATQPAVKREGVRAFLENPKVVLQGQRSMGGTLEDMPVLVSSGGKLYIQDGHHRLAAKKLSGQTVALARVVGMP